MLLYNLFHFENLCLCFSLLFIALLFAVVPLEEATEQTSASNDTLPPKQHSQNLSTTSLPQRPPCLNDSSNHNDNEEPCHSNSSVSPSSSHDVTPLSTDSDNNNSPPLSPVTDNTLSTQHSESVMLCGDLNSQTEQRADNEGSIEDDDDSSLLSRNDDEKLNNNNTNGISSRRKLLNASQLEKTPEMESLVYSNNNAVTV